MGGQLHKEDYPVLDIWYLSMVSVDIQLTF